MKTPFVWLMISLLSLSSFYAQEVTGWRHDGMGLFPAANPPLEWGPEAKVKWKTEMPAWSNASPVLVGDRLFVCSEPSQLLCLSADDGTILWKADNGYDQVFPKEDLAKAAAGRKLQEQVDSLHKKITKNPNQLELYKQLGDLCRQIVADPANAERFQLAEELKRPRSHNTNGYSSPTPVSDGQRVFLLTNFGTVASYSLDGKRHWIKMVRKPTHGWGHSASPVLAGNRLVVHIAGQVIALNPDNGEIVWQTAGGGSWGTPLPVTVGGKQAVVTSGGDLIRMDDGKTVARKIVELPWNGAIVKDGIVYVMDLKNAAAVQLPETLDPKQKTKTLWQAKVPKDRYYASPVLANGVLYNITRKGVLTALDAADGKELFSEKMDLGRGTAYPSLVLVGEHILVSMDNGTSLVIKAARKLEIVGKNKIEPFRTCPLPADDRLYIRTHKIFYCFAR